MKVVLASSENKRSHKEIPYFKLVDENIFGERFDEVFFTRYFNARLIRII
jgi:hypothetical protein